MTQEQKLRNRFHAFLAVLISGGLIFITSWKSFQVPKTYTVTLSIEQWEGALQSLDSANKVLVGSDAPARNVSYVTSKISSLMQAIQMQVGQQMQAEQKTDSTKPKIPKK